MHHPAWSLLPHMKHFFTEVSRLRIERASRRKAPAISGALPSRIVQFGLVAFDRQHVVGPLGADRLGRFFLAMHGIQCPAGACKSQQLQELWHCGDLVGVLIDGHLSQADLEVARSCVEQLQGVLAGCRVERVPKHLAG